MPRQKIPDYKCQQCPSIYLSQNGLDNHIVKEHSNQREQVPGYAQSPSTPSLPKYIPRNRSTTYNCKLCNFKYLEQSGLDKHMVKDHNVTSTASDDVISPMSVLMNRPTVGQVANSTYTPRRRTQDFKCQYCPLESPSIYLTESGLSKHVEKEHNNPVTVTESPKQDWKPVDITEIVQRSNTNKFTPLTPITKLGSNIVIEKVVPNVEEKPTKRKGKKEKDPNAPKRGMTAYFMFMGEERKKVKEANPEFGVAEIGKELGRRWNNLDESLKGKYNEMAAKDRARYEMEMKEYRKSQA